MMKSSVLDDLKAIRENLERIQKEREDAQKELPLEDTIQGDDPGDSEDYMYGCGYSLPYRVIP